MERRNSSRTRRIELDLGTGAGKRREKAKVCAGEAAQEEAEEPMEAKEVNEKRESCATARQMVRARRKMKAEQVVRALGRGHYGEVETPHYEDNW